MAHLSSGSIVGVGQIKRSDPYPHLEGWLIKWSTNGCLEPSDCATVSTHENLSGGDNSGWKNWEIYPNPASDHTWLYPPEGLFFKHVQVDILDGSGKVAQSLSYEPSNNDAYKIPVHTLTNGLYFYRIIADGAVQKSGRFVVMR